MKKTMKKSIALLLTLSMVLSLSGILAVTAGAAASSPMYDPTFNKNAGAFFANGTPITIYKNASDTTVISWDGGTLPVGDSVTVFGGGKAGTSYDSASITMNGGTVGYIVGGGCSTNEKQPANVTSATVTINGGTVGYAVGGGMLYGTVDTTSITVNGGTIGTVMGGGMATATIDGVTYIAGLEETPCAVGTATVTINDGTIYDASMFCGLVYGGGQGYSRVTDTTVTINGGDLSSAYVTVGGSNGYTGSGALEVTGGSISVIQGVNRGTIGSVEMVISGGTVTNCYVGGESGDPTVNGTVTTASFLAYQEARITWLKLGTSGGAAYDAENNKFIEKVNFRFSPSCVTKYDEIKARGTTVWTVTYDMNDDGETPNVYYAFANDTKITWFPEDPTRDGYTFGGWYRNSAGTGEKITSDTYTITADTTLYAKWTKDGNGPTGPIGGGGGASSYSIESAASKNGTFTVDKKNAPAGSTVTITVKPDKGFTLETITVLDQNGNKVEVKSLGDGKYSFKMPDGKVTIKVTFMEDNTMLNFCVDVKADDYYYDAVLWAYENGICTGIDNVHFAPEAPVTRGQVVTFLWRAAGSPEPTGDASKFADVPANEYYAKAVAWAIAQGITNGMTETAFEPETVCTRGQIVTFLARFAGEKDTATESAFTDVPATEFFAAATKWAADNGVTTGVTATTFEPYTNCNRGQVVTFLYRWMVK